MGRGGMGMGGMGISAATSPVPYKMSDMLEGVVEPLSMSLGRKGEGRRRSFTGLFDAAADYIVPEGKFKVLNLVQSWGSMQHPEADLEIASRFYGEGMEEHHVSTCSYPNCCVLKAHEVGPDMQLCSVPRCTGLVHLICQGNYEFKHNMDGENKILCMHHSNQLYQEQIRMRFENLDAIANEGAGADDQTEDGHRAPQAKRKNALDATFFKKQVVIAAAKLGHTQPKGTEVSLAMKRGKLRRSEPVLRMLEQWWAVIAAKKSDGEEDRKSCTQNEYLELNLRLIEALIPDLELTEDVIQTLQNDFWLESQGKPDCPKERMIDIMMHVTNNWVTDLSEESYSSFLEDLLHKLTDLVTPRNTPRNTKLGRRVWKFRSGPGAPKMEVEASAEFGSFEFGDFQQQKVRRESSAFSKTKGQEYKDDYKTLQSQTAAELREFVRVSQFEKDLLPDVSFEEISSDEYDSDGNVVEISAERMEARMMKMASNQEKLDAMLSEDQKEKIDRDRAERGLPPRDSPTLRMSTERMSSRRGSQRLGNQGEGSFSDLLYGDDGYGGDPDVRRNSQDEGFLLQEALFLQSQSGSKGGLLSQMHKKKLEKHLHGSAGLGKKIHRNSGYRSPRGMEMDRIPRHLKSGKGLPSERSGLWKDRGSSVQVHQRESRMGPSRFHPGKILEDETFSDTSSISSIGTSRTSGVWRLKGKLPPIFEPPPRPSLSFNVPSCYERWEQDALKKAAREQLRQQHARNRTFPNIIQDPQHRTGMINDMHSMTVGRLNTDNKRTEHRKRVNTAPRTHSVDWIVVSNGDAWKYVDSPLGAQIGGGMQLPGGASLKVSKRSRQGVGHDPGGFEEQYRRLQERFSQHQANNGFTPLHLIKDDPLDGGEDPEATEISPAKPGNQTDDDDQFSLPPLQKENSGCDTPLGSFNVLALNDDNPGTPDSAKPSSFPRSQSAKGSLTLPFIHPTSPGQNIRRYSPERQMSPAFGDVEDLEIGVRRLEPTNTLISEETHRRSPRRAHELRRNSPKAQSPNNASRQMSPLSRVPRGERDSPQKRSPMRTPASRHGASR